MRRYLYFTVFVSGMTTLAAELTASRLIGNTYGTSNLVWAAIIGLILIYLALGYFLGGRWADRSPAAATMYGILAWGAFTLGIVPHIAGPVLLAAANAFDGLDIAVMLGAFAAVLVLFSIPITLLGMISPFAIRLSMDDTARAGNIAGNIYAISTLGSFIGTFLPVLVIIPMVGTRATFNLFSLFLLGVAVVGLLLSGEGRRVLIYLGMAILLIVLAALGRGARIKESQGQIYESESAYNYIQVLEVGEYHYLRLNDGQGVHSVYHPEYLDYNGPWEQFLAGPFFNPDFEPGQINRIAIVGSAAGTTARQATAIFGPIPIDGFEIDPKIVDVGREYFGMTMPNFNVSVGDGRYGLAHSSHSYDLIAVDAYRPPYIPWHMTTQEFFQAAYNHLNETGVLAINAASVPGDRRLINGLATTIASVFPSVYVMDLPGTLNSIIYATKQPTRTENLSENLLKLYSRSDVHPLLVDVLFTAEQNLRTYDASTVFTDDLAPIEWITNDMVIRFVLSGEVEILQ